MVNPDITASPSLRHRTQNSMWHSWLSKRQLLFCNRLW